MSHPCGKVVLETINSRALEGNALADPATRHVPGYLPPGYESSDQRFPTLYLLAGFTGSGRSFLNFQAFGETIPEKLDRLIASGAMGEMIVVMPDCFTRLGGSQYINSEATGNYEDHLVEEIIPQIDARYRTLALRQHRGIVGKSSGGYGALVQGMRHPDLFGAVASHAGDCAFELCYLPDFAKFVAELSHHGTIEAFLEHFAAAKAPDNKSIMMMNVLAMAAAYSPNSSRSPVRADFPFDLETAELVPEVWERWLAWDPVRMVSHHGGALSDMQLIYLDAGLSDEFHLQLGARILSRRLTEAGIVHFREEFEGGHFNINHRYDVSFPKLWDALRS
jgi:S-formylglutathione hydrolase FrmB